MKIKGKSTVRLLSWMSRARHDGRTGTNKYAHVMGKVRKLLAS